MKESRKLKNVALLATSHNVAKAYITRLNKAGFEPNRVILLDRKKRRIFQVAVFKSILKNYSVKEISKKVFKKLTTFTRSNRNELQIDNIGTVLSKVKSKLIQLDVFSTDLNQPTTSILKNVGWNYDKIEINSINDQNLINYLQENVQEDFIIFSGGGILRDSILSIGKRFIHVHPGIVPEVKGADCLLWSALVYEKIGMSSIIMNKGIDTGDIIHTSNFEIPKFEINIESYTLRTLKQTLINFVDPHYRAEHLVVTFKREPNPEKWDTIRQNTKDGRQYYFMHDSILPSVISKFVDSKNNKVQN